MSQISQVQITFVPGEDRLLLRVATGSNEEFRFWLTRRFVRALRPQLEKSLSAQPRIQVQPNPDARRELLRFEHQRALQTSDFDTPYREQGERSLPLGGEPVLLTRFQLQVGDKGVVRLGLRPEQGRGIDLNLDTQLSHSLLALVDNACRSAEWDVPAPDDAAVAAAEPDAPVLN